MFDIRIRAEVTDENANELATLDRTYVVKDMSRAQACFEHATRTGILLIEGIQMETGHEQEAVVSDA